MLIKYVSVTIENEARKQKRGFLSILGASFSGNLLIGKGVKEARQGRQGNIPG